MLKIRQIVKNAQEKLKYGKVYQMGQHFYAASWLADNLVTREP